MFKKILLAVDSSQYSDKVVETASEIAAEYGSEVVILNAYYIPERFNGHESIHYEYLRKIEEDMINHSRELLENLKKKLESKDIKVKIILEKGHAGSVIVSTIVSEECDLVVVGSRGLSSFSNFLIGSVSNYVIHHSKCPVLIIK